MLSDHQVVCMIGMMKNLTELDLSDNPRVGDEVLSAIPPWLKQLQLLNIQNCNMTSLAVKRLLLECPSLRTVIMDKELAACIRYRSKKVISCLDWMSSEMDDLISDALLEKIHAV
jgi:hypothetical protein